MSDSEDAQEVNHPFSINFASVIIKGPGYTTFVFKGEHVRTSIDERLFLRLKVLHSSTRRLLSSMIESREDPSAIMTHVNILKDLNHLKNKGVTSHIVKNKMVTKQFRVRSKSHRQNKLRVPEVITIKAPRVGNIPEADIDVISTAGSGPRTGLFVECKPDNLLYLARVAAWQYAHRDDADDDSDGGDDADEHDHGNADAGGHDIVEDEEDRDIDGEDSDHEIEEDEEHIEEECDIEGEEDDRTIDDGEVLNTAPAPQRHASVLHAARRSRPLPRSRRLHRVYDIAVGVTAYRAAPATEE